MLRQKNKLLLSSLLVELLFLSLWTCASSAAVSSSKSMTVTATVTTNETLTTSPQAVTTESEVPTASPQVTLFQTRTPLTEAQRQSVSTAAKIENATEIIPDPCDKCSPFAICVRRAFVDIYDCYCRRGYHGDGNTCLSKDDLCAACSPDADCEHSIWHGYECRCRKAFRGDGHTCSKITCANNTCHSKATCRLNEDSARGYDCICNENEAYYGDGFDCHRDCEKKCHLTGAICPTNRTDSGGITVTCQCRKGYIRDRMWCVKDPCARWEECVKSGTCDTHWVKYGKYGIHASCRCRNETLSVEEGCKMDPCDNACHRFASCVQNEMGTHQCVCQNEYGGDGYTCSMDHLCDNACSPNADCKFIYTRSKGCYCRAGFYGDGYTCRPNPCYEKICPTHSTCKLNWTSGTGACFCDLDGRLAVGEPCKELSCANLRCPPPARCMVNNYIPDPKPHCSCPVNYCFVDGQCIETGTWSCLSYST